MKKKKMILGVVIMLGMVLLPIPSKAVLQANPNTSNNSSRKDFIKNWITIIRQMENKNQAMGLEETTNGTTLKGTSPSNGIDVHMIKTTEWGTVAILSASGYGNSKWLQNSNIKSTTGNRSGIYFSLDWEVTAGVGTSDSASLSTKIDDRYCNVYRNYDNTSAITGDALGNDKTPNLRMCKLA